MKRLSLTNKTKYVISDSEELALRQAIEKGAKYVIVQGDTLMLASIIAIQDEEIFEEAEHERNRDYKCVHGYWHMQHDKCYGHDTLPAHLDPRKRLEHGKDNAELPAAF